MVRPHAKQMPLFGSATKTRPTVPDARRWEVGFYVPSGKVNQVFYIFNAKTLARAKDAQGRRRKFKSWLAARKAADALEKGAAFVRH